MISEYLYSVSGTFVTDADTTTIEDVTSTRGNVADVTLKTETTTLITEVTHGSSTVTETRSTANITTNTNTITRNPPHVSSATARSTKVSELTSVASESVGTREAATTHSGKDSRTTRALDTTTHTSTSPATTMAVEFPAVTGFEPGSSTLSVTGPVSDADDMGTTENTAIGISGFILIAVVIAVMVYLRKKCWNRALSRQSSKISELDDLERSIELSSRQIQRSLDNLQYNDYRRAKPKDPEGYSSFRDIGADLKRRISKSMLIDVDMLSFGKKIGNGQFGCVYEGKLSKQARSSNDYGHLTHETVAIKTIKDITLDQNTFEDFLREGLIMMEFSHKNVLSLTGVAIGDQGMPMIVLPYMANGSLKSYIMKPRLQLTVRALLEFALQVAHGMEYLALQKFVHRDLAARNCMLDDSLTVKVADFGLSRDIYIKEYYCSEDHKAKLPVKWMAIESLSQGVYTTKSDVWSYGIMVWELLTRGVTPYPDVSNWDMNKYLKSGRRLEPPQHCPASVYDLMKSCWLEAPRDRPSFTIIIAQLSAIIDKHNNPPPDQDAADKPRDLYVNINPHAPRRKSSRRQRPH